MSNELLKQEIERAMDNAPLQKALKNFTTAYPGNRARVYKGYDFEALREKVHEVKSYARDHLDEVMAEFIKNAEANGAHVFVAHSPEEAMDYALKLAKDNNVKLCVKSKSMASEEMHFNQNYEKQALRLRKRTWANSSTPSLVIRRPTWLCRLSIILKKTLPTSLNRIRNSRKNRSSRKKSRRPAASCVRNSSALKWGFPVPTSLSLKRGQSLP